MEILFKVTFKSFPNFVYAHSLSIDTYEFKNRCYNFLEIAYITEGSLEMILDGEKFTAERGDCLVIPPYTIANCRVSENISTHSHLSVGVCGDMQIKNVGFIDKPDHEISFYAEHHQRLAKPEILERQFTKLITEFNHSNYIEATGLYLQICSNIQNVINNTDTSIMGIIYTRKIIDYIQNNLTEKITISKLSEYLSITPEYASCVFKSVTNETIISFINTLKIKKARELIVRGGESIESISNMVGIYNPSYFSRLFKKYVGIPPSEYKNSMQREFIEY